MFANWTRSSSLGHHHRKDKISWRLEAKKSGQYKAGCWFQPLWKRMDFVNWDEYLIRHPIFLGKCIKMATSYHQPAMVVHPLSMEVSMGQSNQTDAWKVRDVDVMPEALEADRVYLKSLWIRGELKNWLDLMFHGCSWIFIRTLCFYIPFSWNQIWGISIDFPHQRWNRRDGSCGGFRRKFLI